MAPRRPGEEAGGATGCSRFLGDRLSRVAERIGRAAERSGRPAGSVRIVAVTKGRPPGAVTAALDAGLHDVGENRIEELETKAPLFHARDLRWHMIGHVQSRKAARAVASGALIHSVDSLKLARRLSRASEEAGRRTRALVQVNASGEATKGGLAADAALDGIAAVAALPGLGVEGLMTMAPLTRDESVLRRVFARTREAAEAAAKALGMASLHLSMGMSNDYEIAVEEGSTMVRLGTALFGPRPA